jgi:hypothetical protein
MQKLGIMDVSNCEEYYFKVEDVRQFFYAERELGGLMVLTFKNYSFLTANR